MDTNAKSTPVGKPMLHKELSEKPRKEAWNYQTAVVMINYFQGYIRPDMSMAVHQTAHFCNNPMLSHKKSNKRLGRYLLQTNKEVIIYNPDTSKGLECYGDADFSGGWSREVGDDADNVMSRNGMVVMYDKFPVYWRRSLQTEIVLSTYEA